MAGGVGCFEVRRIRGSRVSKRGDYLGSNHADLNILAFQDPEKHVAFRLADVGGDLGHDDVRVSQVQTVQRFNTSISTRDPMHYINYSLPS